MCDGTLALNKNISYIRYNFINPQYAFENTNYTINFKNLFSYQTTFFIDLEKSEYFDNFTLVSNKDNLVEGTDCFGNGISFSISFKVPFLVFSYQQNQYLNVVLQLPNQ